jgi:hypothetical protein
LNLVLFSPLGAGLALLGWRRQSAVIAGLGLTLLIEVLQYSVLPGRYAALGDVVANTLGTWVGHRLAGPRSDRIITRTGHLVRGAATWLAAVSIPALAALSFQPSPGPGRAAWYGQWANLLEGMDPFGGTILDVRLDSFPVPMGRLSNAGRLRQAFGDLPLRFEARVRTGSVPRRRSLVATIANRPAGWPAAIWQDGLDATMSLRFTASDLGVRNPAVRLTGAFDHPEGTELVLSIEDSAGTLVARAASGSSVREAMIPLRTGAAWIAMWPWSTAFRSEPRIRTALWLLGFGLGSGSLLGYWMASGRSLLMGIGLAATIPVLTHALIPWWAGLPVGTVLHWVVTTIATGIGFGLGMNHTRKPAPGKAQPLLR